MVLPRCCRCSPDPLHWFRPSSRVSPSPAPADARDHARVLLHPSPLTAPCTAASSPSSFASLAFVLRFSRARGRLSRFRLGLRPSLLLVLLGLRPSLLFVRLCFSLPSPFITRLRSSPVCARRRSPVPLSLMSVHPTPRPLYNAHLHHCLHACSFQRVLIVPCFLSSSCTTLIPVCRLLRPVPLHCPDLTPSFRLGRDLARPRYRRR